MKIIFLDIDGVLNAEIDDDVPIAFSNSGIKYRDFNDLPVERCVNNLNKILKATKAELVISSTWRIIHTSTSLMYIFFMCGIEPPYIYGLTPYLPGERRGTEIAEWLDDHEEATNFVILDDDSDMENLMDHLIQIDSSIGLTDADADKAIEMLNKE